MSQPGVPPRAEPQASVHVVYLGAELREQSEGLKWRRRKSQVKGTLLDTLSILLEASGEFMFFCRRPSLMATESCSKDP